MAEIGIFKKAVLNNLVSWKEGEILILSVPVFAIPTYSYIELIDTLKQKLPDTENILYNIGEKQTILAVEYAIKKFGFKKSKTEIIKSVLEQSALLGLGNFKIIKVDFKTGRATFKNNTNPFGKHYKITKGVQKKPVDAYICGTMAGIIKSITNKKVICVETKCLAMGDSCCIFEVKPINKSSIKTYNSSKSAEELKEGMKKEKGIYTKGRI